MKTHILEKLVFLWKDSFNFRKNFIIHESLIALSNYVKTDSKSFIGKIFEFIYRWMAKNDICLIKVISQSK